MISKQNEVLSSLYKLLGKQAQKNQLLLDNFFHSLFPVEKRSLVSAVRLKTLFDLLLEVFYQKKFLLTTETDAFYLVMETTDQSKLQKLEQIPFKTKPVTLRLEHDERFFIGLIAEEASSLQKEILSLLRR